MLSILNNLSAMSAENSLSATQMNLQNTLTQLSTGLRINSGSDDAAGLSIANGLQANIAALTQSSQNATDGVGMLQTADGALSQVTTLLNRAVTLATEAANGTVSSDQSGALDTEFQSILKEVNQIGQTTDFNGQNVFSAASSTSYTSSLGGLTASSSLTNGATYSITDENTGSTFNFTAGASSTVSDLETAVSGAVTAGTLSSGTTAALSGGNLVISAASGDTVNVKTTDSAVLGTMNPATSNNITNTFISDGTQTGSANTTITTTINALSAMSLGLSGSNLNSQTNASSALTLINAAIGSVASQRGDLGASVNRLTAASNVMTAQVQNLTSAANSIMNADVGKTVANMTQYNILQSTGMAALQQANQSQQAVLKLLQ